jgi:hypothetical protein
MGIFHLFILWFVFEKGAACFTLASPDQFFTEIGIRSVQAVFGSIGFVAQTGAGQGAI